MGKPSKRDWVGEAVGWLAGPCWAPQPFCNVFNQLGPLLCASVPPTPLAQVHRLPFPCEFQGQIEPRAWYPYFADDSTAAVFY